MTRRRARILLATAVAVAVGAGGAAAGSSPRPYVVLYWNDVAVHAKTAALEQAHGFESDARFAVRGFRGFRASLTEAQAGALRGDRDVVAVREEPALYLLAFARPVDVDARTRRLEQLVGFRSDLRYRRLVHGFAARLSVRQALTVAVDTAFDPLAGRYQETFVTVQGTGFVVLYDRRVREPAAKTDELRRRLGLELAYRYDTTGGFAARLSAAQLRALTEDDDVSHILWNTRQCGLPGCPPVIDPDPPRTVRLTQTRAVRAALRTQLRRGAPSLRREIAAPRRVRLARFATRVGTTTATFEYAAATFRVRGRTRTDLFRRHLAGSWLWLGRAPGYVCTNGREPSVPAEVIEAWGFRVRTRGGCFRFPRG